jgi:hypothetical protein
VNNRYTSRKNNKYTRNGYIILNREDIYKYTDILSK